MVLIVEADAVVYEYAVMIQFRDTTFAYAAVFGTSRFQNIAGLAFSTWMKDSEIIRI